MVREREMAFMVVVFTSVVFLFLSGLTWPRYAMSPFWYWVGNCIPAVWGVEGFIRINSNGADLSAVQTNLTYCFVAEGVRKTQSQQLDATEDLSSPWRYCSTMMKRPFSSRAIMFTHVGYSRT